MADMLNLQRLVACAEIWQDHHKRDLPSAVEKIAEEIDEFREEEPGYKRLDELSDILVNALRAYVDLTPDEKQFVASVATMKAQRRTGPHGVKDKKEEAILTKYLADLWFPGCQES